MYHRCNNSFLDQKTTMYNFVYNCSVTDESYTWGTFYDEFWRTWVIQNFRRKTCQTSKSCHTHERQKLCQNLCNETLSKTQNRSNKQIFAIKKLDREYVDQNDHRKSNAEKKKSVQYVYKNTSSNFSTVRNSTLPPCSLNLKKLRHCNKPKPLLYKLRC